MRLAPSIAALALLGACTGSSDHVSLKARSFETPQCRAKSLPAERPASAERGFQAWRAPEQPVIRLVELEGDVVGEPTLDGRWLARWTADELAAWERTEADGEVRLLGPVFDEKIPGDSRLRIVLQPGEARSIGVVPSPKREIDRRVRGLRTVDFSLDEPSGDEPVVITADLEAVLTGNWGDDTRRGITLRRLEIAVPAEQAEGFSLEEIAVEGPEAAFADAAAGTRTVGLRGALHPAWFVHSGASVTFALDVPDDAPELRWYDGTVGGNATRQVRIRAGERVETVFADRGRQRRWALRTVSLHPWAGQRVQVELSAAEGGGVGLFGAPRVISTAVQPATPNVILYMVDTLRADHLGAWGSRVPEVSPHFDRLAGEGAKFDLAISTSPWTKPAIPSLLTGLMPTTHRVGGRTYVDRLPDSVVTLPERFRDAGWRTGSFSSSPLGSTLSGLEQGFDTTLPPDHWRGRMTRLRHVTADQLHEALLDWYRLEPAQPFFGYVHTLEPHAWRRAPYSRPPRGMSPYDYAVQDADTKFGRLRTALEAAGLADNTLIVVVSDHGESFGDHGVKAHGSSLYQSQVHVPLVFHAADLPSLATAEPVSLVDIPTTLLDLFDLEPLPASDGRSLVPYFEGGGDVHDEVFTHRVRYVWTPQAPPIHAVVHEDGHKLIRQADRQQAFDVRDDLCEAESLSRVRRSLVRRLDEHLEAETAEAEAFRHTHGDETGEVDASDVEMLRELGYLE